MSDSQDTRECLTEPRPRCRAASWKTHAQVWAHKVSLPILKTADLRESQPYGR
jgi:hypothetical protein